MGISFPNSVIGSDEKDVDDIVQHKFGIDGFYIGVHESGFTVKGGVDFGVTTSKDVSVQEFSTNIGAYEDISFGTGYSFVNTENTLFGITAMVGCTCDVYPYFDKYDVSGVKHEVENTLALVTANAGLDVFVRQKIGSTFGFYAGLSMRYVLGGVSILETSDKYKESGEKYEITDEDKDLLIGKFQCKPSIGFTWTF